MSSPKALERVAALAAVLDEVAMDDARVVKATAKCFQASRGDLEAWEKMTPFERGLQLQARGWTEEEFQIALESRKPRSEASYGVQMSHERVMARIRQAAERGGPTVNVAVVLPAVAQVSDEEIASAPVIDVGDP